MKVFFYVVFGCLALILAGLGVFLLSPHAAVRQATSVLPSSRIPFDSAPPSPVPATSAAVFASIPYWDQTRAVASLQQHVELIDYVSLFWYYLGDGGNIERYAAAKEDAALIAYAQAHGVKVFALVANLPDAPDSDWDADRVGDVIHDPAARAAHIEKLVTLVHTKNFDGINIDYEALEAHQRDDFTTFIQELGTALHDADKLLGVAIHPKTSEGDPQETNGSEAQDWVALHPHVDHLYFMTYGEHYSESDPGPIASPQWITRVLEYAAKLSIPSSKIFLGMPLYAAEWRLERGGRSSGIAADLLWTDVQALAEKYAAALHFDTDSRTPYMVYERSGQERVVWFENAQSIEAKIGAAKRYGIQRVALWRLGGEDPRVWEVLARLTPSAQD